MEYERTPPRLGLGISIALVAYIFFVTASSLVASFRAQFPTIQILFVQNCVCLLFIAPIACRFGFKRLKTEILPIHLVRDFSGVTSYYLYFVAIRYLNLADATTLNYTAPFFVPIIWWVWMKEKIEKHIWWSIIIGFFGVALILNPTKQIFQEGFVFGIFAGLGSAISFIALRIINMKQEPMSRTLLYYFLFSVIFTAPFAILYWIPPNPLQWVKMIAVGLATVIAQMLLTIAYRHGTAAYLSPLGYATIIYAMISSWIFFDKQPTIQSFIGTIFIIAGGTLSYLLKKKPETLKKAFQVTDPPKKQPPL